MRYVILFHHMHASFQFSEYLYKPSPFMKLEETCIDLRYSFTQSFAHYKHTGQGYLKKSSFDNAATHYFYLWLRVIILVLAKITES